MTKLFKISVFALILLGTTNSNAQFFKDFFDKLYVGFGVDPKMVLEGPGHNYTDKNSTFDYEVYFGFEDDIDEYNGFRFTMAYQSHHEINFDKWTVPKIDWKLRNHLLWMEVEGFNQYAGVEFSIIYRGGDVGWYWVDVEKSLSVGANFELAYNITEQFSVGASWNSFLSEKELIQDDKYLRHEGRINVYYKF
jgi:hypothetical protein